MYQNGTWTLWEGGSCDAKAKLLRVDESQTNMAPKERLLKRPAIYKGSPLRFHIGLA